MSTRASIAVSFGRSRVFLYRHWDGYPAETGADIVRALSYGKTAAGFLAALLAQRDEATSYCGPRPVFELTTDIHADVQWIYSLSFPRSGRGRVEVACVERSLDEDASEAFAGITTARHGELAQLIERVNADRRAINSRLLARQREGAFTDVVCYQMVEAPAERVRS